MKDTWQMKSLKDRTTLTQLEKVTMMSVNEMILKIFWMESKGCYSLWHGADLVQSSS